MSDGSLPLFSLVVYKNRPARVVQVNAKKITLEVESGPALSVRPKDVTLLHPGPLAALSQLTLPSGDVQTAWELLAGGVTSLAELAELAFGSYTPASAWAVWQLAADGLLFSGEPEKIVAHSAEFVAQERADRAAKADAERAWRAFTERVAAGQYAADDAAFLDEIKEVALGQRDASRVLRALGRSETPEQAHALLLALGYWDISFNPYPARAGIPTDQPDSLLPDLPAEERRDLTRLTALAIDDEGSRDPDDAISLADGVLWVHIADVGALITPDSPADLEARARAANLYLPEGTVAMLPPEATTRLALGLTEVSPALSFGLTLGEEGAVTDLTIVPSWVRVTRLSYEAAETQLDGDPMLRALFAITRQAAARRWQNGAIEIDLPEARVRVVDGQVIIRPLPSLRSREVVREAMLMTGEAVAGWAMAHHLPLPFISQPPADIDDRMATTPSQAFALRRSMPRSQAQLTPGPHSGLGLPVYVQATSPLRRYLDLVVHQQIRAWLRGGGRLGEAEVLERIGSADAVAGSVRWAERQSNLHWTLVYLLQNPDWEGEGIVVEKRGARDVVLIPELAYETQLYLRHDPPLDSRLRLGVSDVRLTEREASFRVVGHG